MKETEETIMQPVENEPLGQIEFEEILAEMRLP